METLQKTQSLLETVEGWMQGSEIDAGGKRHDLDWQQTVVGLHLVSVDVKARCLTADSLTGQDLEHSACNQRCKW
jgi:hypothetical protein